MSDQPNDAGITLTARIKGGKVKVTLKVPISTIRDRCLASNEDTIGLLLSVKPWHGRTHTADKTTTTPTTPTTHTKNFRPEARVRKKHLKYTVSIKSNTAPERIACIMDVGGVTKLWADFTLRRDGDAVHVSPGETITTSIG